MATSTEPPLVGDGASYETPDTLDDSVLDSYSRTVSGVAERLLPSVAALRPQDRSGRPIGAGSGVIVSADGLLVTSAHVVARSEGGRAAFSNGEEARFSVVGSDPASDLAVVRAEGNGYQPARLGSTARLRVGQLVVAIGNPLGFEGSVSAGVISALGRNLPGSPGTGQRLLGDVIQTDASLHPGNSGGALATANADVVGINTALVGPWVGQGLGMAVPLNDANRAIIGTLAAGRRPRRAYLGIGGRSRLLPASTAKATAWRQGVEVMSVHSTSPAGHAGLRPGDIIVSLGGQPVRDIGHLQSSLVEAFIGQTVDVGYIRGGRFATAPVICNELPSS